VAFAQTTTPSSSTSFKIADVSKWTSKQWNRAKGQVGKGKRKMDRQPEAVEGSQPDRSKELVGPRVLHDQLKK
jgi:hypothetical protein